MGVRFRAQGRWFRPKVFGLYSLRFMVSGLGSGARDLGFGVKGWGFMVWGLGFGAGGQGIRIQAL